MSSRGRVRELERIFNEISEGGNCFTTRTLKKFINQDVNTDMLPSTIYLSDFLDAFQNEVTRLKDQEEYLKYQVSQYRIKKRMHLANFDEALANETYNDEGIMENSRFDLIIEEARELPAMNTNNTADAFFTVTCDEEVVYQSDVIPDTADPIWNSKVTIAIKNKSHIVELEVWDDDTNPELIGSFAIELESYEDQQVHSR